jgi:hypothetical protein
MRSSIRSIIGKELAIGFHRAEAFLALLFLELLELLLFGLGEFLRCGRGLLGGAPAGRFEFRSLVAALRWSC